MRNVFKLALVLGVVALVAAPALAQRPGGGGRGFGLAGLISNMSVQEEIKIDADTAKKAGDALQKVGQDNRDEFRKLFDMNTSAEERATIRKKMDELNTAALKDILKPEQMTRLKQIELQQRGLRAFEDPEIQKAIKLTDDQVKDIKTIGEDVSKERRSLFPQGQRPDQGAFEKMAKIESEAKDKVMKMLSADQKKAWEDMAGKPFEIKREPRPNQ